MVLKEGKVIVVGMLAALFLAVANSAYFLLTTESSIGVMSGNSIKDVVSDFYRTSSVNQRIFILFQFFLLVLIVAVVLIIVKKFKSKSRLSKSAFVKSSRTGSMTDLDILYEMLKKDKEVGILDIGKVFKVTPEVALDWAKVLENGNLATIEYPRFGKPVLRLFVKEEEGVEKKDGEEKKVEKEKHIDVEKKEELQNIAVEKVTLEKVTKKDKDGRKKIKKIDRKIKKKIKKIDRKIKKLDRKIKKRHKKVSKRSKKLKKK